MKKGDIVSVVVCVVSSTIGEVSNVMSLRRKADLET